MGKSLIDFPLSKYTPIKSDVSASPAFFGWLMLQNVVKRDQFQYVSNSTLTPPQTQQPSTDYKLRLMLG